MLLNKENTDALKTINHKLQTAEITVTSRGLHTTGTDSVRFANLAL